MKNIVSRRKALTTGLVASSGFMWSKSFGLSSKNILGSTSFKGRYASLVKHGQALNDNYMLWSLMTCDSPEEITEEIMNMRKEGSYNSIIKYSSNDKYKEEICSNLLFWILERESVQFKLLRFENYSELTSKLSSKEIQERTINAMRQFGELEVESINSKLENGYGPTDNFNESLQGTMGSFIEPKPVYKDQLIQLNDLVSGVIYSLIKPKHNAISKVKLNLQFYGRKAFGIEDGNIDDGRIAENITLRTAEF